MILNPTILNNRDASILFLGIETITDPVQVTKLSQDYHTFSPILQLKLAGKTADVVVFR